MPRTPPEEMPTPQSIANYAKKNAGRVRQLQEMRHEESVVTRTADYKGHHIVVRTSYEVEIDGHPLMGHLGVNDEGAVHYHPVPNLSFLSALEMVKKIIDVFPDEFGEGMAPPDENNHSHGRMSTRVTKKKVHGTKQRSGRGKK